MLKIADALELGGPERYNLLLAAGHSPDELAPIDPSAFMISRALEHPGLTDGEKSELRGIILLIVDNWIRLGEERKLRGLLPADQSQAAR